VLENFEQICVNTEYFCFFKIDSKQEVNCISFDPRKNLNAWVKCIYFLHTWKVNNGLKNEYCHAD